MIRALIALAALCFTVPAYAACVWTAPSTFVGVNTCGDGDEVAPAAATEGLALSSAFYTSVKGLTVTAAADSGATITSGTLKAYVYNENAAAWARVPELDLTVSEAGSRYVSWSGMTVTVPKGRIAWVPSVVVLSAGGITVYVTASN